MTNPKNANGAGYRESIQFKPCDWCHRIMTKEEIALGPIKKGPCTVNTTVAQVVNEILNGDFGTGDLTDWNSYNAIVVSAADGPVYPGDSYSAHPGFNGGEINQQWWDNPIPVNSVVSIDFCYLNDDANPGSVMVQFADDSYISIDLSGPTQGQWACMSIASELVGITEPIVMLMFSAVESSSLYIDNVVFNVSVTTTTTTTVTAEYNLCSWCRLWPCQSYMQEIDSFITEIAEDASQSEQYNFPRYNYPWIG